MAEVSKQPKSDLPSHHFPDELLMELFLRLPVRSLLLFRSVCKRWLTLIQNPTFINLHINRPIHIGNTHQPLLILHAVKSNPKLVLTLLSDDEKLGYNDDLALEVLSPSMASWGLGFGIGNLHLIGPCNGLFCLASTVDVVLFNPTTRRCRNVPRSIFDKFFGYLVRVGLGFDPVRNDYMVVRFKFFCKCHVQVEIFSLNTNSWRKLDCGKLDWIVSAQNLSRHGSPILFLNGACHWLGGKGVCSIIVFDLNKEAFDKFELPDDCFDYASVHIFLSVLNESIALLVQSKSIDMEVWVMKEYGVNRSWSRLYNIESDLGIKWPLSFTNKGEFLLLNDKCQLKSYNIETRTIKEFEVHGVSVSFQAFRYRESLVSLT